MRSSKMPAAARKEAMPHAGGDLDALERPPVCVIGGRGGMGSMLMRELATAGYAVAGLDKTGRTDRTPDASPVREKEWEDAVGGSLIILLAVPATALRGALEKLAPLLTGKHILMDITSVKSLPMQWMEAAFSGPVIGSHPLFGPVPNAEDMRVALVRGQNAGAEACGHAEALFRRLRCATFWTTAEEHDTGVAFAQSLNFTVSAAFFCALARHEGIRPFLTPSFKRHLEAARKHLTQDTAMFLEFTALNPAFASVLGQYQSILTEAAAGNLATIAAQAASWYAEGAERNA